MYKPQFVISNLILRNIGLVEAAKAIIDVSPLLPSWEKRFQNEAIFRSAHHGTHLEGNALDLAEARRVMEGEKIIARERDIQEIINYRNVTEFIGKIKAPIDLDLLENLHYRTMINILPEEQLGKLRSKSVVIRNSRTGQVSFQPPPAVEVPYLLRHFFSWLDNENKLNSVLKAGISQYEFVRIHPFADGNGRVARALTTLILYQEGYDIRRFFSLEEYYDKNAEGYYKALQSVAEADLTPWLEYFTEGLAIEFNRVKEKVQKISRDINFRKSLGGQIYLTERQIKIIEHLQETGSLQNQAFLSLFPDLSEDTILRELNDLIKKNIIQKKGKTKAARYVIKP